MTIVDPYDLRLAFAPIAPASMPAGAAEDDEPLDSPEDVAAFFGMSLKWVYATYRNEVEPIKVGGRIRWRPWQKHAYADQHREVLR